MASAKALTLSEEVFDARMVSSPQAASKVLNTLTGKMNNVRIEARGQEYVPTEGGDVKAMRYAYTGELETEVWYDQEDRWVKMRFVGKDGVSIDYVCRKCQGPNAEPIKK